MLYSQNKFISSGKSAHAVQLKRACAPSRAYSWFSCESQEVTILCLPKTQQHPKCLAKRCLETIFCESQFNILQASLVET